MKASHFDILVEEPSMEAFLNEIFRREFPDISFAIHVFQEKRDLLDNLQSRLNAYAKWLPPDFRVVVVIDRDRDDCRELKLRLEDMARGARLLTRSTAGGRRWQAVNRIAVEELEAWYFGDWNAVRAAYPRVAKDVPNRAAYRDPDGIKKRNLGSVSPSPETRRLLQDGFAKSRSGAGNRREDQSPPEPFAQFREFLQCDSRGCLAVKGA